MAHKTLIDGTAYSINGGNAIIDGTSYKIKNGKTHIDGTDYDISFKVQITVGFSQSKPRDIVYVVYNGKQYPPSGASQYLYYPITAEEGDTLTLCLRCVNSPEDYAYPWATCEVEINGERVHWEYQTGWYEYTYTVVSDARIECHWWNGDGGTCTSIKITES